MDSVLRPRRGAGSWRGGPGGIELAWARPLRSTRPADAEADVGAEVVLQVLDVHFGNVF